MARIDVLLEEMVKAGASDLHMVPGVPPMLRLRGDLVPTKHGEAHSRDELSSFFSKR